MQSSESHVEPPSGERLKEDAIRRKLAAQAIETPSWGYGNSGTRFKTFAAAGAARNIHEKIADAALIHQLSGVAPRIALHIPWDKVDDFDALKAYAAARGVALGAINPNLFQKDCYKLGSLTHPDKDVRQQAVAHLLECCAIMAQTGSKDLSLWLADGTNYAGQDDFIARRARLLSALKEVYPALPEGARLLVEYKPFEPAFYQTDLADWGMALLTCHALGDKAQVLVDLGHHLHGCNIEQIVALLLDEGRLGGFHFNSRRYADDDLIVGSGNPFELFCIYAEIVKAEARGTPGASEVSYMIDQSHNIEPKLEAMLQSVLNCQLAYAKALHLDLPALQGAQQAGDVLAAQRLYQDAFNTDVAELLREVREALGAPLDPIAALRNSDEVARREEVRGKEEGGGGYPAG